MSKDKPGELSPLTIIYKSGTKIHVTVERMTISLREGELTKAEWSSMLPDPMHLNLGQIESIWRAHV